MSDWPDDKDWYAPPELAGTLTHTPMTKEHLDELKKLADALRKDVWIAPEDPCKCKECERIRRARK